MSSAGSSESSAHEPVLIPRSPDDDDDADPAPGGDEEDAEVSSYEDCEERDDDAVNQSPPDADVRILPRTRASRPSRVPARAFVVDEDITFRTQVPDAQWYEEPSTPASAPTDPRQHTRGVTWARETQRVGNDTGRAGARHGESQAARQG